MTQAPEIRRTLKPDEFRNVIGHFASGVTVVTTVHDGKPYGTTASAVTSVSLEPPMLLICMNRQSETGQAVAARRRFAVNILGEDQPDAAVQFARKGDDKFVGIALDEGEAGVPLLRGALATLECRVVEEVAGGTHTVFLAEVDGASARAGAPLAYFRGEFGRLELAQDEHAYRDIRALVMNRDIAIGVSLRLDDLAARLGLPRGAVYHAVTKLASDGLVTRDLDGTFVVTPLTLEVVEEALRARAAIELGAATLTIGRLSAEQLAELRALMEKTRPHSADAGPFDMTAYIRRYEAFREYIVGLVGSPALVNAYRRVNTPLMITSLTEGRAGRERADVEAAEGAFRHNVDLVGAIEAGALAAAAHAITRHMERSIEFSRRYVDAAGGRM
jgi:flavin reductase (DIM6/NTAB) family NADH-FMN oxidoreductase RutF/DNA-binding GntR family transcriptional regulator